MKLSESVEQFIDEKDKSLADPRGQNAKTSGAFGYLDRVKNSQPIPEGLALVESQVQKELAEGGPINLLRANVIRLQAAADLLWGYMAANADRFHAGLKPFGWLTNSSIRALEKLAALEKDTQRDMLDLVAAMSEPVEQDRDES